MFGYSSFYFALRFWFLLLLAIRLAFVSVVCVFSCFSLLVCRRFVDVVGICLIIVCTILLY